MRYINVRLMFTLLQPIHTARHDSTRPSTSVVLGGVNWLTLEFHDADTDTDMLARILADTSDTRDFLKLLLLQAERHADILATILARMSVLASWNASLIRLTSTLSKTSQRTSSECLYNKEEIIGERDSYHRTV